MDTICKIPGSKPPSSRIVTGGAASGCLSLLAVVALWSQPLQAQSSEDADRALTRTRMAAAEAYLRHNQTGEARRMLEAIPPERRNWPWRLLSARADRSARTFRDHRNIVTAIAMSPDGLTLATGSADSTILLRNAQTGEILRRLTGHAGRVTTLNFHPKGTQLLSGGTDKTLRLWDVRTGNEVRSYPGEFAQGIYQAGFSRDGNRVAAASWELSAGNKLPVRGFIKILDAGTGALLRRFDTDDHPAASAVFTPDDSALISGTWGFHVKRHDLIQGKTLWDYDLTPLPYYTAVQWVDVSGDGKLVVQGGKDNRIRLLDAHTGALKVQIDPWAGHTQWVNCVRFSPDGSRFASAGDDGILKVWQTETAREEFTLRGHLGSIHQLVWSRDGRSIWSVSADSTTREWALDTPGERTLPVATTGLWAAPVHPAGGLLAAASFQNGAAIWNLDSGKQVRLLDSVEALTVTFVRGTAMAAVGTTEGMVSSYDVRTGEKRFGAEGHAGRVNGVAYNSNVDLLASVGGNTVCLWNPDSGAPVLRIPTASTPMTVSFMPDGRSLMAGCRDGWVRVFTFPAGTPADSFRSGSTVGSQAISHDGRFLATGGDGGACDLWDVAERRLIGRLEGHTKWVYGLAFHPSEPFLVTGSYDQTVKVWDLERLEPVLTLFGFPEPLYTVSVAGGGNRLVITEVNGRAHVLDIPTGTENP